MASPEETRPQDAAPETQLSGGAYEIIRNRLQAGGRALRDRLEKLNDARKEIFGAIDFTLLATDRISTRNNCIPRDMTPLGKDRFIFGYNVHMGLRSEFQRSDVFAVYRYQDREFHEQDLGPIADDRFEADFKGLYRYYRETQFVKFSIIGPHLFMVFKIGKTLSDIKVFKWRTADGGLEYIDNRSEHEFKFPPQHEFTWTRTHRDLHRFGKFPHIAIEDRLFVETVGGDITFKVEDNTDTGHGIYAEPVDNPDQTLDDAEIFYASLGHVILVRIKPYMEERFRHFIFNEKTGEVHRVDEIVDACVLLPDDQGLIFSNGYYLQTGELKRFDSGLTGMTFTNRIASANGEDYLYVFYQQESGDYILLSYNIIDQQVDSPVPCNGYSVFQNGEMLVFRGAKEPARHHAIQVWRTPYVSTDHALTQKIEQSDAFLYKLGNPDIVRCMAECNELLKLISKEDTYSGLYMDLMKKAGEIADAYFWLDRPEAFNIKETLSQIRSAARSAIDEFEKVSRLKTHTAAEVKRVSDRAESILQSARADTMEHIDDFVERLAELRRVRGEIISLKELRYIDLDRVEALETEVAGAADDLSGDCVNFLLKPESLSPYEARVAEIRESIDGLATAADADRTAERVDAAGESLEMLIEIVSNLKIEDATQTTQIIDNISAIYSRLNSVKASLKTKRKSLQSAEGEAQFNAQMKLLNQSVINYLDISDTPAKCEEYLTKTMIAIEELEGRFADFDEFVLQLSEKRDELYNAFETRKLHLVEARDKKANTLMSAAERIIKGIGNRVRGMADIDAINAYFASDMMVEKIRDIVRQLLELDDTVKADDIQSRLKTVREDAVRQLKDRQELFEDGANIIKMGEHRFTVNVQALDLTVVERDGDQWFHLTGTDFFERIDDPSFNETRPVWEMAVPSENETVYRGEYLAFKMLEEIEARRDPDPEVLAGYNDADWLTLVQGFMGPRYTEGYTKGIHDRDGARLLSALYRTHTGIGLLRYHPRVRALARVFWECFDDPDAKAWIDHKLSAFGTLKTLFAGQERQDRYIADLETRIAGFARTSGLFPEELSSRAARYLFDELTGDDHFAISREAFDLVNGFEKHLREKRYDERLASARERLESTPAADYELVRDWVRGYAEAVDEVDGVDWVDYVDEAAVLAFLGKAPKQDVIDVPLTADLDGMTGDHTVIRDGVYRLDYLGFMEKLERHETVTVPLFNRRQTLKKQLTDEKREEMRLDEFKPRILSSFVRNRLINKVYLPLIGDNLAKQIGVAGEGKRTDLMGLLLLISPPGYGKTTLMEYMANRLGIIFMKINGPAIGHRVTSLDPTEAPFASAREEIEKLNLALEMGDNVMLYLDDIQHCNPELLQKFISLCDAQRKIEGVYQGRSRTYDLRGKKVVVVMAGNPYTESGEKFRIPDMLANRADTYNLGDIIGDSAGDFKMSYLENCLTSNPVLNTLSSRSQADVYGVIRIAETGSHEGVEFSGNYGREEVDEMVSVMQKLMTVRDVILKVNEQYIYSAAQADEYRTEPPFRLQGSYRNMNRLAEKVLPVMNDAELKTLILSHYENESQTLTTGAEANFLKFKELVGWMDDAERARWEEIKKTFKKNQLFRGTDAGDPVNRVVVQLSAFQDGLESIKETLAAGIGKMLRDREASAAASKADRQRPLEPLMTQVSLTQETLAQLHAIMKAMNLKVDVVPNFAAAPMVPHTARAIHKMPRRNSFYKALKTGDVKSVRSLLEAGQDPNIETSEGATPLMAAAFHNQPEIIGLLLDRGAEINAQDKDGYTALMIAASKGHKAVARVLMERGADMALRDKDDLTARDWAEKNGKGAVAGLISWEAKQNPES